VNVTVVRLNENVTVIRCGWECDGYENVTAVRCSCECDSCKTGLECDGYKAWVGM
jgi:hypothetical protein